MKRLALTIAAVLAVAFAVDAATAASVPTGKYRTTIASGFLAGKWTMDFYRRGRYKVTGPFGSVTGRTSFNGARVTFSHESQGTMCPGAGTYSWKLVGRKLTLKTIKESCRVRRLVHARTWTKPLTG